MIARDVMSSAPVRVDVDTSLDEAMELMDRESIRHLPVVRDDRLVGIVSDRDLLEATGWLPRRVHACRGPELFDRVPHTIGEVMQREVLHVSPAANLRDIATHMLDHHVGCVPVVQVERLAGIVTESDVVSSIPLDGTLRVGDVMTRSPYTLSWYSTLKDAAEILYTHGVRHLPIVEADCPVGLLSDRDLRRALGAGRHDDTPIDGVLTRPVISLEEDDTLDLLREILITRKIGSVCVVNSKGLLIGIACLSDLLRLIAHRPRKTKSASTSGGSC